MKNQLHSDIWLYRIVVTVFDLTVVSSAAIRELAGLFAPSPLNR